MEQRLKDECNQAFHEFIRTLENASEDDDEGFVDKVLSDLRKTLSENDY